MSSYVEVRGVKIGEGVPKICVPIVGKTKEEILAAAKSFADVKMDVVEWRVDWFDGVFDFAQVEDVLKDLRPALGNTPILFTFRTSKEGGEKAIEPDVYVELNDYEGELEDGTCAQLLSWPDRAAYQRARRDRRRDDGLPRLWHVRARDEPSI